MSTSMNASYARIVYTLASGATVRNCWTFIGRKLLLLALQNVELIQVTERTFYRRKRKTNVCRVCV